MVELKGILPALITPFDAAGRFNPSMCEALLGRLYTAGVHGVYPHYYASGLSPKFVEKIRHFFG